MNHEFNSAINAQEPVVNVTASAGSGKTRLIIERVRILIERGTPARAIKVITYTNAAAEEMRQRLALVLPPWAVDALFIGTLNSFALKTLREEAETARFSILNRRGWLGSEPSLWRLIDDSEVDRICADIRNQIGKNKVTLKALKLGLNSDLTAPAKLNDVSRYARQEMRKLNYITQDDLVEMIADAALTIAGGIAHLIVDEAQDLPHSHRRFINAAANAGTNVFLCQDDAQAIFGFLSSRQEQLGFEPAAQFSGARYTLSNNYRSTPQIVELANKVRARLAEQGGCSLIEQQATCANGDAVTELSFEVSCDANYNETIPAHILSEIAFEFAQADSCALLCRTWAEVALFREHLIKAGVCDAEDANLSLKLPQNRALLTLAEIMSRRSMSISDLRAIAAYQPFAPARSVLARTAAVAEIAIALYQQSQERTLAAIVDEMIEAQVWTEPASGGLIEDLCSWWSQLGGGYSSLAEHASAHAAGIDDLLASAGRAARAASRNKVVTTIHQAKGLEFDSVVLYAACDGVFPSSRDKTPEQINEAGRCLYTAITRAKKRLVLLTPTMMRMKPRQKSFWLS